MVFESSLGFSPFLFLVFLADQSGAGARDKSMAHQLFIGYLHTYI